MQQTTLTPGPGPVDSDRAAGRLKALDIAAAFIGNNERRKPQAASRKPQAARSAS